MLTLPPFLLGGQASLREGDVRAGFDLTGHFLDQFVFGPLNRPLPPARVWADREAWGGGTALGNP